MTPDNSLTIMVPTPSTELTNFLIQLCWAALGMYAIYLSFKCNKGTFNPKHFFAAFFLAPVYVLYQIANSYETCLN